MVNFRLSFGFQSMNHDSYCLGGPPRPPPLRGPGWGPLAFPGGPLLGPGARVTGALGLGAANDTSFCSLTPFAAAPGFVLGDLLPFSITTSETTEKEWWGQSGANWLIACNKGIWECVCVYQVGVALPRWEVVLETCLAAGPLSLSSLD